jgi:YidC/Oxa1 family membrane protein insertase
MILFDAILINPILNLLILFYKIFLGNFGWAIIGLTLFLRVLFLPLTIPSLKAAQKQRELQPELAKLKKKHGKDREKMARAQMDLFRRHNINPASGCFFQLIQIVFLIALYQVFIRVLNTNGQAVVQLNQLLYANFLKFAPGQELNLHFFFWDLAKADPYLVLPVLAGLSQFALSKLMMPAIEKGQEKAKETPDKSDDLMYTMQSQTMYLMPLMTVFIGWRLPSGLVLYWLASTLFSLGQQIYVDRVYGGTRDKKNN